VTATAEPQTRAGSRLEHVPVSFFATVMGTAGLAIAGSWAHGDRRAARRDLSAGVIPFQSTTIKGIRTMKIAITSQNRKEVTGHAGQCRNFWIVELEERKVANRTLVELGREETFHGTGSGFPPALQGVDVLVSGGMGPGLRQRLAARGITAIVTTETDVERAIAGVLAGTLTDEAAAQATTTGCHDHEHSCGCGHGH
jgi:predicted Fe-Mo cluster-binding NifX family protein